MNSSQRKTLEDIFRIPTSATIKWNDIESLLKAVGAIRQKGDGSRLKFFKGTVKMMTHRPHPGNEAKPYQVATVREFLEALGVRP